MPEILKPVQLSVEKDLSGGVKLHLGGSMAVMSPEQAIEFAMVVLEKAGAGSMGLNFGSRLPKPAQRHFRPG